MSLSSDLLSTIFLITGTILKKFYWFWSDLFFYFWGLHFHICPLLGKEYPFFLILKPELSCLSSTEKESLFSYFGTSIFVPLLCWESRILRPPHSCFSSIWKEKSLFFLILRPHFLYWEKKVIFFFNFETSTIVLMGKKNPFFKFWDLQFCACPLLRKFNLFFLTCDLHFRTSSYWEKKICILNFKTSFVPLLYCERKISFSQF